MNDDKFNETVKHALLLKSDEIKVSENLLETTKKEINKRIKKESNNMKIKFLKPAIIVCALLLTTTFCYSAFKQGYSLSHSYNRYTDFPTVNQLEDLAGFTPKYLVEDLGNGYVFSSYSIKDEEKFNEKDEKIAEGKGIDFTYKNADDPEKTISFSISSLPLEDENNSYSEDKYKFVVPEYTPTKEELEAQERGELYISYGASENTEEIIQSYTWKDDSKTYCLLGMDTNIPKDEFIKIVEMIKNS